MFRLLLQLALIGGGAALGASHLDGMTMDRIQGALRDLGLGRLTPGKTESLSVGDKGMQTNQGPVPAGGGAVPEPSRKAFYGAPPEGCHWEKIIDPSDGSVRCVIPERRTSHDH